MACAQCANSLTYYVSLRIVIGFSLRWSDVLFEFLSVRLFTTVPGFYFELTGRLLQPALIGVLSTFAGRYGHTFLFRQPS